MGCAECGRAARAGAGLRALRAHWRGCALRGERAALARLAALLGAPAALRQDARFWEPAYLWPHGWLAIDLDDDTDWEELAELLTDSYCIQAPATLAEQVARPAR